MSFPLAKNVAKQNFARSEQSLSSPQDVDLLNRFLSLGHAVDRPHREENNEPARSARVIGAENGTTQSH